MPKSKLGTIEAIMLVLTIVVAHSVLSMPTNILSSYKSASILNVIYVSVIAIAIAYLIYRLLKNFPNMDIIDVSEAVGGKTFKNLVGIVFIVYFVLTASLMLRNFCESIQILYFPMTDITFIMTLIVIAVCIANRLDFNATAKTNVIILPIALIGVLFLFFTNINRFVPQRIFPILGEGAFNTFVLGLTNIASFGGIAYIYFLPPLLKDETKLKKITLISIIATSVYLIFTIATLLFIFTFFTNVSEISPLYTATRYIEFGSFFQRLESVFLLIWILVFACYLSIVLKFSMGIFQKVTGISNKKALIDVLGLLILGIALIPKNLAISQSFESKVYPYLMIGIVLVLGIGILIFAKFAKKKQIRNSYTKEDNVNNIISNGKELTN